MTTEAQRAAVKRFRERNPKKMKAWATTWRDENREAVRKYNREYQRKRRAKAKRNGRKAAVSR